MAKPNITQLAERVSQQRPLVVAVQPTVDMPEALPPLPAGWGAMTSGNKAAWKRQNWPKGATAAACQPAAAAAAVPVTLTVESSGLAVVVTCSASLWHLTAFLEEDGSLGGSALRISLEDAEAGEVMACAREVGTLQDLLDRAREESEDVSLAHAVTTLAAHYRAVSIMLLAEGAEAREIRRGQSYMVLHAFCEAHVARNAVKAA